MFYYILGFAISLEIYIWYISFSQFSVSQSWGISTSIWKISIDLLQTDRLTFGQLCTTLLHISHWVMSSHSVLTAVFRDWRTNTHSWPSLHSWFCPYCWKYVQQYVMQHKHIVNNSGAIKSNLGWCPPGISCLHWLNFHSPFLWLVKTTTSGQDKENLNLECIEILCLCDYCSTTKMPSTNETHYDTFNTLRPRQHGRHFADDTCTRIFLNENVIISIKISLKFVPKGPISNIPALVQIMAWRRPGDKPLSEAMMVSLLTHICVTLPQWVKSMHTPEINQRPFKRNKFCQSNISVPSKYFA